MTCKLCRRETPLKGYIREWCTAKELQRISRIPGHLVRAELDAFDREKFGFVPPRKTPMEQFEEASQLLNDLARRWRGLGANIGLPDES